ncbi:MAG: PQQ-binding-like beta-propeller repeat protein [Phycisphaerae bacterium]
MRHQGRRLAGACGAWLTAGVLGVLAAGCGPHAKPGGNAAATVVAEPIPAQSFKREWAADLKIGNDAVDRMFVSEDLLFVYTKSNTAYVMNRASGRVRFFDKVTTSKLPPHPPVVLKERIVFPTSSTLEVYRRDGLGKERSFSTKSSLRTNAVGWPGGSRVYYGVDTPGAGRMTATETLPGDYKPVREVWELMSTKGAAINSAPTVWAGVVYVAFDDGEVYAVNGENRATIWATSTGTTFKTFGPVNADLRSDEYGVYVPSTDTKFYCLERGSGRKKWEYFAGHPLTANPETTLTTVYLPVSQLGMVAIDKTQGGAVREPKWVVRDMTRFLAEDEKHAYFQRNDNTIVAVDKASGEQRFTNRRRDLVAFASNPRDKDGTIYAATREGLVVAIRPVLKPGDVGETAWVPVTPDAVAKAE